MTFDLDAAVDRLLPWEFEVTILGNSLKTRRPSVAEFGALLNIGNLSDEDGANLLNSLFVSPEPVNVIAFGMARIQGFLVAYLTYFKNRSKILPIEDIAAEIREALAKQSTPKPAVPPGAKFDPFTGKPLS